MSLRTQIELMTIPQEFTRLCNATLIAEHGDDFLPIDDDRGDRGNDGYLKSEARMFAAHCFKRIQNQSIDAAIRTKMIGDLGKAIALKTARVWEISCWTFLSNYPVSEKLGAELVAIGTRNGIDVSWRGADYFANVLSARPEVAANFPGLQVNEISHQLAQLQAALAELSGRALIQMDAGGSYPRRRRARDQARPSPAAFAGVPRTDEERYELLDTLPPAWEYLLWAGVLRIGRDALETKWRDHELTLPSRVRQYVGLTEMPDFLSKAYGRLGSIIEPMSRVFADQEAAFGAPGEPGDAVRIEHFANWIIGAYEDLLDWAMDLRATDTDDEIEHVVALAAKAADRPLSEIREFIDRSIAETERIPAYFAKPEAERGDPLVLESKVILTADEDLLTRTLTDLRDALGMDPN
jgi:hypothetical protein